MGDFLLVFLAVVLAEILIQAGKCAVILYLRFWACLPRKEEVREP